MLPSRPRTPFRRYWFVWIILAVVLVAGLGSCLFQPENDGYETEVITRGEVVEKVRVTGQVQAKATYDLRFEVPGTIATIPVSVGDVVSAGTILSTLEGSSQQLALEEAQTRVRYYQTQVDKIKAGSTTEAVGVAAQMLNKAKEQVQLLRVQIENTKGLTKEAQNRAQLMVEKTEVDLESLLQERSDLELRLNAEVRDAEVRYQNAVAALSDTTTEVGSEQATTEQEIANAREQLELGVDGGFVRFDESITFMDTLLGYTDKTSNDTLEPVFSVLNTQARNNIQTSFVRARASVQELRSYRNNGYTPEELAARTQSTVTTVKNALDDMRKALDASMTNQQITQSVLDGYKSQAASHIQEMNTLSSTVQSRLQSYITAKLRNTSTASTGTTVASQRQYEVNAAAQNRETVAANVLLQKTQMDAKIRLAQKALEDARLAQSQVDVEWAASLRELEQTLVSAQADVTTRNAELAQVQAGPRAVDIAPFLAELEQARVQLKKAEEDLKDLELRTPVTGVVTDIKFERGEKVTASDIHIVLNAEEKEIQVDVSETDIARVSLDAPVIMTFDALDYSEEFLGTVIEMDPAETIIDGVTYYRVRVRLNEEDERIRSGMTANMEIISGTARDVLLVPALAVKYEGSKRYVDVLRGKEREQVFITIGLEGDLHYEVTSGLAEGDIVITFED